MNEHLRVILSMIELEIRRLLHDRTEMYVRAVQPMLWLLIFGHVLGAMNSIPTGGIPYTDYITAGVLVQSTTTIAIFFGLIIIWERESGVLKKLVASPAPKSAIVAGRSMAAGTRALSQAIIIVPFAMLIGVNVLLNPFYLAAAMIVVFISSSGFAALSILVASFFKTRERFMGLGQVIVLPLFFGSNALYPLSSMPPILRDFASINPMTYMVDALRGFLITGDLTHILPDLAVIAVFTFGMIGIASIFFKRIIE